MKFERIPMYDELLMKAKKNKHILTKLDYEQLVLFTKYLVSLNKFLATQGEDNGR